MTRSACRGCSARNLIPILSLGRTPLANALLSEVDLDRPEPTYPLDLVFCELCSLVQITVDVPPRELFEEYLYHSSYSDTMVAHARRLAQRIAREESLGRESLVIEVASNDGYLLKNYIDLEVPVLGIEPARNIAAIARDHGVETVGSFFGLELARSLRDSGRLANVVHAHNVLAHVPDLGGVLEGMGEILAQNGIVVIEVPYVRELVERCEFDTIYHEHLSYFSLNALVAVAKAAGLIVHDVERVSIHGGSLRVFLSRPGTRPVGSYVDELLAEEGSIGLTRSDFYADFAARVKGLRAALVSTLADLKRDGASIAAYGAAAKGATLLNYAGVDAQTIDFVSDRSPHKQGRYMPGAHIPIVAPTALLERRPDFCLLLAWNFETEILVQQSAYRAAGGRFIIPVPTVRIL